MLPKTSFDRRSAIWVAASAGVGGLAALGGPGSRSARASHVDDLKAVYAGWLEYTDAAGMELGRIHPNVMLDVTNHDGVETPQDRRDWWLHVTIRNTGPAELVVEPAAFALWTTSGYLHRPLQERPRGYTGNVLDDTDHGEHALVPGSGALPLTADPIAPRTERSGNMLFRIPATAWLAGLLFTPEPDRVFVVARFPASAGSIIID